MTNTHGRKIVANMTWKRPKGDAVVQTHYQVTELDYAALVRACAHEGAPHAEVCRTLLQRFAWIYPTFERLEDFVLAYCQPINPHWFPDGRKHKNYIARLTRAGRLGEVADQERRAKNRVKYASQPIDQVEGRYHTYVRSTLADDGDWPQVRGAVHYRAGRGSDNVEGSALAEEFADDRDNYYSIDAGHGFKAGTTWFFGVSNSRKLELTTQLLDDESQQCEGREKQEPQPGLFKKVHQILPDLGDDDLLDVITESAKILNDRRIGD